MTYLELKNKLVKAKLTAKIVVAAAEGEEIFTALKEAADENLCYPVLVGNRETIGLAAERVGLKKFDVIEATSSAEAAAKAVQAIRDKKADLLMKGNISTDVLLKAVLNKTEGLRTGKLLSHVAVFEDEENKFLGVTDGGINIQPDLNAKIDITNNAINLFRTLDIAKPRVAILSAIEKVNPNIPASIDAAALSVMAKQGQIANAIIDGPVAFDLAVSAHARKSKKLEKVFTANADILVVPELICGNVLCKTLIYKAKYQAGGIIIGAVCPIILLSRSDSAIEKLNSIILGVNACSTF